MLIYPELNPIALKLGPFAIHWYGLMYLLGFLGGWVLLQVRIKLLDGDKPFHRVAIASETADSIWAD